MKTLKIITALLCLATMISCVQEEHLKKVTFQVDMNAIDTVGIVQINGDFVSPPWSEPVTMTDNDNDGVYEFTVEQETAKSTVSFKFIHNNTYELKDQNNRKLQLVYEPEEVTYYAVFDQADGKQENTPLNNN